MISRAFEKLFHVGIAFSAWLSAAIVVFILGALTYFSHPLWHHPDALSQLFNTSWEPFKNQLGLGAMILGSIQVALIAMLIALPIGMGLALLISHIAPKICQKIVRFFVDLLSTIPTVVYAFVSFWLLIPYLRDQLQFGSGFSWLAAGLTLGFMLSPSVTVLMLPVLEEQKSRFRLCAASLGIGKLDQFLFIDLPQCWNTMISVTLLTSARAMGDTLIALMLGGGAPIVAKHLSDPLRTLTSHIAMTLAADTQSAVYQSIFCAALLLLVYIALVQALAQWMMKPWQK